MTYYIDPETGVVGNHGHSEESPLPSIDRCTFEPGDTVLFKRGTVIRSSLQLCGGNEKGVITYGAYGVGENPVV